MSTMPGRLFRLLSLLQSRREWSGHELAERLGVTERTVRRDVERLRALDYPVTGTTGAAGGYRLGSGTTLPPLLLDDDEAIAVALGLVSAGTGGLAGIADSSMSALAKLTQVLPARLRPQLAAMGSAEAIPRSGIPQVDPDALATLARCCRNHEVVAFDYVNRQDVSSRRRVEPHQLLTVSWHWYLLAFDPAREDWRFFRVDRIADVSPALHRFVPRTLPAGDAASYLVESFTSAPYRHRVRLTVQLPADEVSASIHWFNPGRVAPAGDSACVVEFAVETPSLLLQLVAGIVALGADFTVDEASAETAALIADVGRRLQSFTPR
ncbi:helix-turn-helix transcriptional regulator [Kribbella albertanoniae]|uniref:Transcriptional regulator n=1 Tax=Kribbella albertanoniae TaxID=1266829 RepID=A0A4R4PMC3_9ACTN|nr:transcriptional regulator [Kribbella albertanoniae]TDC23246.1 transcriptional regulator [Kribbella albertanoniae]